MAKPAWNDDLLACYPYLLDRLRGVQQISDVLEAEDFAAMSGPDRNQVPLDGAVYVMWDGLTPQASNNNGREQTMTIGFSIILTKTHYTPKPQTDGVSQTLTAICKALQGFDPIDEEGRALVTAPFAQRPPIPFKYEDGFAFFPLRFTAEVTVIADNDSN
ncbi:MAG: hypothetical protein Q4P13_09130 [Psychrobacter sp.]|nr:hypothetical protein [Psychrobacter sp.]